MSTSITIVRSARNNRILIVDNYLYNLEDRRKNLFRWVCARRKGENCRARVVTMPVVDDDTRHVVVRINSDHTHEQSTKFEIEKALRRPQIPGVEEKTHIAKVSQRKAFERLVKELISGSDEDDDDVAQTDDEDYVADANDNDGFGDTGDDDNVDNNFDDDDEDTDKYIEYVVEEEADESRDNKEYIKKCIYEREKKQQNKSTNLRKFQHNKVYMFRTPHNRELVCINGFLYRLEGKSRTSITFRWECIRTDVNCKTRIYTEKLSNTQHNVKEIFGVEIVHNHEHYTPNQLAKFIEKHNIRPDPNDAALCKQQNNLKMVRKRKLPTETNEIGYDMDITKVSQLRSAKGGVLLCVDGYIYHKKSEASRPNYWVCIKNRDYSVKCKSFVKTSRDTEELKVIHVTNKHNHPVNENDIKRRLCNELTARGALPKKTVKAGYYLNRTLEEVQAEYEAILNTPRLKKEQMQLDERKMKLYAVSDGPPSLAVRMTFKALNIPFELVPVDYVAAEHLSETYAKMNPQKEIPVLDDDGFYLSESIAIMQYLCDKYAPNSNIYPKEPTARALVNHRLCFNMGFYYASISVHAMAPIFFDYPRNEMTLKKVNNALSVFETYLQRSGTKYAAANHVTIADFALVSATLCLEGIGFDLSTYPLVKTWYETFKQENPTLWEIGNGGMQEIATFDKNPPDLSHMNHPFHPTKQHAV